MGIGHDSAVGLWCRRATTDLRERKGLPVADEVGANESGGGVEPEDDDEDDELELSELPVRCVRAVQRSGRAVSKEVVAVGVARAACRSGDELGRRGAWAEAECEDAVAWAAGDMAEEAG